MSVMSLLDFTVEIQQGEVHSIVDGDGDGVLRILPSVQSSNQCLDIFSSPTLITAPPPSENARSQSTAESPSDPYKYS
ncbi:hypothetical protein L6452_01188 [Arctium lappa]|uniref:Uncharacterized protein n=1 Tax=Arctium lappa TaxID=4217 RepID=A0ACB9FHF2_ARCLA|nr:hypothetical protein L6452_01188 [Arctium lappa]